MFGAAAHGSAVMASAALKPWLLPAATIVILIAALLLPVGYYEDDYAFWWQFPLGALFIIIGILGVILGAVWGHKPGPGGIWAFLGPLVLILASFGPVLLPTAELDIHLAGSGVWLAIIGLLLFAWQVMQHLTRQPKSLLWAILVPLIFGLCLIYLWQAIVIGFNVPQVLLPSPTQIVQAIIRNWPVLMDDFRQTFLKAVIAGFVLGNVLAFITALLVDRVPFLQRGLLPLGNLVSAVPIVGIAPIMVMWFGFGWESKTAVIVFMIFFPMLINALTGLAAADAMLKDLMRSYAAGYWQTLLSLRLPVAMPFIFNALKINSTLALIGAIVAEFFGSPIAGMGFRISVEVARMNVDVVWATIAIAALAGSIFYGLLAVLERAVTFWHPSYRSQ
jgi:NitT/TauT family transport system permease protein